MARKRLVSPKFFLHGALFDAEQDSGGLPIRLAYAGLWGQCDRRGLFEWKPRELKLCLLPYDVCDFAAVLDCLLKHGFIEQYEVNGVKYGRVPTLGRWQNFHYKEVADDFPDMPTPDAQLSLAIPKTPEKPPQPKANLRSAQGQPEANPPDAVAVAVTVADAVAGTVSVDQSTNPPRATPDQQRAAFAAVATVDELAALDALLSTHRTPPVLLAALYGIGTGAPDYVVHGEHRKRASTLTDVARALGQYAIVGKAFDVPLFRGFVKRVIDQPPDPGRTTGAGLRVPTEPAPPMRGDIAPDGRIVSVPVDTTDEDVDAAAKRRAASVAAMAAFKRGELDTAGRRLFGGTTTAAVAVHT